MKPVKVVYIISGINNAVAFEWIADCLDKQRFQLTFILLVPGITTLENLLQEKNMPVHRVTCRGKTGWPRALLAILQLLRHIRPDAVHCHLLDANILGLLAAKIIGVKKRIYTRHHSSQHHVYHPKGVLWDRLCNRLATKIIAISPVVYNILTQWEGAPAHKVKLIPHGFNFTSFLHISQERIFAARNRMNLPDAWPVIGVASRFTALKGVNYIIEAFIKVQKDYPQAALLLLNAKGDDAPNIQRQLGRLPTHAYRLVPFEKDMGAAFKLMDVFVHAPIDEHSEAFGQVYVEALAAGTPSVFSRSGIAGYFIKHGHNARTVPFKDVKAIAGEVTWLLQQPEAARAMAAAGRVAVQQLFPIEKMIRSLEQLYEN